MPRINRLTRQVIALLIFAAASLALFRGWTAAGQLRALQAVFEDGARIETRYIARDLAAGGAAEAAVLKSAAKSDGRIAAAMLYRRDGSVIAQSAAAPAAVLSAPASDVLVHIDEPLLQFGTTGLLPAIRWTVVDRAVDGERVLRVVFDAAPLRGAWLRMIVPAAVVLVALSILCLAVFLIAMRRPVESLRAAAAFARALPGAPAEPLRPIDSSIAEIDELRAALNRASELVNDNALAAERRLFQSVLDALPINVSLKDADGRYVLVNRTAAATLGREVDEIIGKSDQDLLDPAAAQRIRAGDLQALAGEAPVVHEDRIASNGEERFALVGRLPQRGPDGARLLLGYSIDISQRVRAETEVQRQRALLRAVIDELPYGVALKTREGQIVLVNAYTARRIGLAPERVEGQTMDAVAPDEMVRRMQELDGRLLAGGKSVTTEFDAAAHRPGDDGTYVFTKALVRLPGHVEPLIMTTTIDVTALRRSQRDLARQRELLRVVIDADEAAITMKDDHGRFVLVNTAFLRLCGKTMEQVIGQTSDEVFVLTDDMRRGLEVEQRARETNRRIEVEQELVVDGRARRLVISRQPVIGPDGDRLLLAVAHDVTELRRQAEALARQRQFTEEVVDLAPNFIHVKNAQLRYVLVNAAFAKAVGRPGADIVGRTPWEIYADPTGLDKIVEADRRALEEGTEIVQEDLFDFGLGPRSLFSTKRPITLTDGSIGVLGVITDITEIRQNEERLREALRTAQAASEAKSRFLANMSHEIRTPINGMMGLTDLALGTQLSAQQREWLRLARASADSLLAVVNDVLDVSKIEAGGMTVERAPFELHALLADTCRALALRAADKHLGFDLQIALDVPERVTGDPTRLRQVMTNLIGNAVKFTAGGEVRVRVESVRDDDGAARIRFAVEDSGPGIPPDKQGRIFEAFTQADDSTTRRFGGTGLGLTICARLVELMGGRIALASVPGHGSSFSFTLDMTPARASSFASMSGRRIAWVAGAEGAPDFWLSCLRRWGAQVYAMPGDGEPALPATEVDTMIVATTGRDDLDSLVRRWRGNGALARIVALAQPAGSIDDIVRRLPAARGLPIVRLARPFTPRELHAALNRSEQMTTEQRAHAAERLDGRRVLLVEDNAVNRLLAVTVLEKLGAQVTMAEDGEQALVVLQRESFDVVLMDIQMPRLDGTEAVRRWRALERERGGPPARILAMTAHAMSGDRERFLQGGFDGYVGKPFSQAQLVEEIRRLGSIGHVPARADPDTGDAFSLDALKATIGDDHALAEQVAATFLQVRSGLARRLRDAVRTGGIADLADAAHELKGMAAMIGAQRLSALAKSLEYAARSGSLPKAAGGDPLAALEDEWERVARVLQPLA